MKVCFETFGCRLNRAEALQMEADYLADGWDVVSSHSDADLIVVRGCSVTQRAQRECEKLVEHLEKKYPAKKVLTVGCLKQSKNSPLPSTPGTTKKTLGHLPEKTSRVPTRTARAYLKVQDGCNCACTFCIVPQFRGKSSSMHFSDILSKAEKFIENGYHELVITGCNLSQYLSEGKHLPELLDALAKLSPDSCRIRLGSLEPSPVATSVIDVIASNDNFCKFLHIPVQSGSDKILLQMKRPYKISDVNLLVSKAIRLMPNIALGCDIITGFPGETELDFLATKSMFARLPFTKAHVFPYSRRPGTVAYNLKEQVSHQTRSYRAHEIAQVADAARVDYIKKFKGREVKMLIEHESPIAGWTSEYIWCQLDEDKNSLAPSIIKSNPNVKRKEIVTVRVKEVRDHKLIGDLV